MSRPRTRTEVCDDIELVQELRAGYKSLATLAEVSGVSYAVLGRVVNGGACTEEELRQVRTAWAKYSPDALYDTAERVLGELEAGVVPHRVDVKELRVVLHRLIMTVRG